MSLRDLPPVEENVPPRDKASQTLLSRQAVCPRSAYLYLRHDGGAPSHEMHRGSAFHEFAARATGILIEQGEHRLPWEVGKDLVAQVVAEHPEWAVPPDEMDVLRLSAYHWCDCTVLDPESVVAVEKLFELEVGGMRVRGKVDLALAADGGVRINDYKTQAFVPSQDEFDGKPQIPLYALLVGEGHPVREEPCDVCKRGVLEHKDVGPLPCPKCDASGRVEIPEAPIGQRFGAFEMAEVYPRLEPWLEGTAKVLPYRSRSITRQELVDQRLYVEGLVAKLAHGLKRGEWPAVPGSHCSTCAAPAECPIPSRLRDFQGSIGSLDEAQGIAENLVFVERRVAAQKRELREFAKAHDVSVPVGADEEFSFETVESEKWVTGKKIGRPDAAAAREAMLDAIERAVRTGEPFDYSDFRVVSRSSKFAKRKVRAVEEAPGAALLSPPASAPPEPPGDRRARLDEQFGAEAPF